MNVTCSESHQDSACEVTNWDGTGEGTGDDRAPQLGMERSGCLMEHSHQTWLAGNPPKFPELNGGCPENHRTKWWASKPCLRVNNSETKRFWSGSSNPYQTKTYEGLSRVNRPNLGLLKPNWHEFWLSAVTWDIWYVPMVAVLVAPCNPCISMVGKWVMLSAHANFPFQAKPTNPCIYIYIYNGHCIYHAACI